MLQWAEISANLTDGAVQTAGADREMGKKRAAYGQVDREEGVNFVCFAHKNRCPSAKIANFAVCIK